MAAFVAPASAVAGFMAGTDRYATAAVIATTAFPSADIVVVTTGENFPDALAASYWAPKHWRRSRPRAWSLSA